MSTGSGSTYQPAYVEDYDSVISEVVPLTRRTTTRGKSGLSQSTTVDSSNFDGVSDSGYSSHSTNTPPNHDTPPPAPERAASPPPQHQTHSRKESMRRAHTPGIGRPPSKSFSRSQTPSAPRNINIPNAKPRDRSATVTSNTSAADECDCSDCHKDAKPSPSSPSILSGAWPLHQSYHGYSNSPSWAQGYQYPPRYDSPYGPPTDSGMTDSSRTSDKKRDRTSMPPPPRPASTFSGSGASSYGNGGFGGSYFPQHHTSSPAPPAPSQTCPPPAYSAYPPPPLSTGSPVIGNSPYAPPPISIPHSPYGYNQPDPWAYSPSPSTSYPTSSDYSVMPPPPPIMNRRNSMRAQASAGAAFHGHEVDDYHHPRPPQRRSSRAQGERPTSWSSSQFAEATHRSMSVPPTENGPESVRRKAMTPGPAPRRRESGHSQSSSGLHQSRLGPSALSRAMESCAIEDDPPQRSHSRSHSNYEHGQISRRDHGELSRRDHGDLSRREHGGALMHHTNSDSGSSSRSGHGQEELVSLTVPDSDEPFTMRYPAGIPVKLQLNGGHHPTSTHRSRKSAEFNVASYRYVQQRQQAVHQQLHYGSLEQGGSRRTSGEYHAYRSSSGGYGARRATMNGM